MGYTVQDIEKIAEFKSWSKKRKIDTLLAIDADIYCNLDTRDEAFRLRYVFFYYIVIYNSSIVQQRRG